MKIYFLLISLLGIFSCKPEKEFKNYSEWMAVSEITRNPQLWNVDFVPKPKWDYTQGLIAKTIYHMYEHTHNENYLTYVQTFADMFVDTTGSILTYKLTDYNLDRLNGGKFLFQIWHKTGDNKYEKAVRLLRSQLDTQPRTSEGGFWHKKVYPHQMWLDGLYMGSPFYAQFAKEFNQPEDFDDVINQFAISYRHTYDSNTGLNFHGWDESREQKWANPETGCSPHVWGRAMGWYFMALVDVLDFIPEDHPRRNEVLNILQNVAAGVKKAQHPTKHVWYQVMDQPHREGNYLEATSSTMFVYGLLKSLRLGYLDKENYLDVAKKGYQGLIHEFIREEEDGTISLTRCCAVAGLGGNPYRDGTYEYYINENIRDNDPKGIGPFILGSLEYEQLSHIDKSN